MALRLLTGAGEAAFFVSAATIITDLAPGTILLTSILGFAGFAAFVPLYVREIGMSGSRGVFAVYSVVLLAIRGFGARIPDRGGPVRTALAALTCTAAGLALAAVWATPVGLYTSTVIFAVVCSGLLLGFRRRMLGPSPSERAGDVPQLGRVPRPQPDGDDVEPDPAAPPSHLA